MRVPAFTVVASLFLWAGSPALGQAGLSFLKIGPDAAALALGEANVARAEGAYSTYWNPAGLAVGPGSEAALSHHRWVGDVQTYAGAARFNLGAGSGLGVSVVATSLGEIESRVRPGDPDGLFTAQFVSAGVAYGHSFGPLRVGAGVKYLSERIFEESANGYAFDLGVQFAIRGDDIRLGAAVQHLGSMQELRVEATPLPQTLRAGISVKPFRVFADLDGFTLVNTVFAIEVIHRPDGGEGILGAGNTQFSAGAEAEIVETVFVRAGYISGDVVRSFSAGIGFVFAPLRLDYAFLPFQSGFGGSAHIITLGYRW